MGLIIICVVVLIICIGLLIWQNNVSSSFDTNFIEGMSIALVMISIAILIISTPIGCNAYMNNSDDVIKYNQNKLYLESLTLNTQFSQKERELIVDKILYTNMDILKTKRWRDNFWIGFAYSHDVGSLELLDIKKVPMATKKYDISIDKLEK